MIAALTITSLDQGKELAHRQVAKLVAEPDCEATVEEFALGEAPPRLAALKRRRYYSIARFLSLGDTALPIGVWRL